MKPGVSHQGDNLIRLTFSDFNQKLPFGFQVIRSFHSQTTVEVQPIPASVQSKPWLPQDFSLQKMTIRGRNIGRIGNDQIKTCFRNLFKHIAVQKPDIKLQTGGVERRNFQSFP